VATIQFQLEPDLSVDEFCEVLRLSGLDARRPVDSPAQIDAMLRGASLIVTARTEVEGKAKLVGVSRAITDHAYCTYLSDLAVDAAFQKQGIGQRLIDETHQLAGKSTTLILLAAPAAQKYYPRIGLSPHESCWIQAASTTYRSPDEQHINASITTATVIGSEATSSTSRASHSDSRSDLADFFDGMASEYDEAILRCFPRYPELLRSVVDYIPRERPPSKIVDLGCGSGTLASILAREFPTSSLALVDLSSESLKLADSRLPAETSRECICGDMASVHFEPGSVDVIVSTIAIHHLPPPEKQELFNKCCEWLSDDGVMVFGDQCSGTTLHSTAQHHRKWRQISSEAGSSEQEWQTWMQHQEDCDYHESIPDLFTKLAEAGFTDTDVAWRYLLWTIFVARR
jgi:tRNA (cmo5U34)-methyltransferase